MENVTALLIGSLSSPAKPFLLRLEIMQQVKGDTVAQLVAETLFKEFENAKENFCLFVTDGAAYCVKAGKALKVFFPSMVHVTCVAHATHLAFEDVRKKSEKANLCIVSLKSFLSKCAYRRSTFPIAFPPWPVITRWGTWVKCGIHLGKNWCVIADWVKNLEDDGIIVADAKRAFADISAQEELLELFPLEPALQYQTKLESHGSTLVEQFDTLQQFQDAVYGTSAEDKLRETLEKNQGLSVLRENVGKFAYAPLVSTEVERLFSVLRAKDISSANIKCENLEKLMFLRRI